VSDGAGDLYGTTVYGKYVPNASIGGTVFSLSGIDHQTFTTLVTFDIASRPSGLAIDETGNLYGGLLNFKSVNINSGSVREPFGTVFELSPCVEQVSASVVYTLDMEAPNIAHLSEISNNARTNLAKAGDVITESFTSTDLVTSVLINGHAASVVHGEGDNYTATYTVQANSINGLSNATITDPGTVILVGTNTALAGSDCGSILVVAGYYYNILAINNEENGTQTIVVDKISPRNNGFLTTDWYLISRNLTTSTEAHNQLQATWFPSCLGIF
jgi:hypothetical protein